MFCFVFQLNISNSFFDIFLGLKGKIMKLVHENPEANFFMEDVPLCEQIITPEDLKEISENIHEDRLFWFACQSQLSTWQQLKDCGNTLVQQFPI
jgi:hypothetical protein